MHAENPLGTMFARVRGCIKHLCFFFVQTASHHILFAKSNLLEIDIMQQDEMFAMIKP